jgi:2-iminobutanoate/2-iminopropanoate deaminase
MSQKVQSEICKPVGPYSLAVRSGGFLFCSGIIGIDKNGNLKSDLESQIEQIFCNLTALLATHKLILAHVVKTTCFLTDMRNFERFNVMYAKAFGEHKPARSTVQVCSLPKGAAVEIEAIAETAVRPRS